MKKNLILIFILIPMIEGLVHKPFCGIGMTASLSSSYNASYPIENVLTNFCEFDWSPDYPNPNERFTYWLGENGTGYLPYDIYFEFGCEVRVSGVYIRNTHNDRDHNAGSKNITIENPNKDDQVLISATLPDGRNATPCSQFSVIPLPIESFQTDTVEMKILSAYGDIPGLNFVEFLGTSYDGYDPVSGDNFTIKTANNAYSEGYCIPWTFTLINPGVPFDSGSGSGFPYEGSGSGSEFPYEGSGSSLGPIGQTYPASIEYYNTTYNKIIYLTVQGREAEFLLTNNQQSPCSGSEIKIKITFNVISMMDCSNNVLNSVTKTRLFSEEVPVSYWIKTATNDTISQSISMGWYLFPTPLLSITVPAFPSSKLCFAGTGNLTTFNTFVYSDEMTTHGEYSQWSNWTECSGRCGSEGLWTRKRECDNPKPYGLGYPCGGPDIEEIPCTANQCEDVHVPYKLEMFLSKTSGQGSETSMKLGEWMNYTVDIDLPVVPRNESIFVLDVTTVNPNNLGYNGYLGRSTMVVCKPKVSYVGNNFETLTYESLNDDLYRDYNSQVTGLEKTKDVSITVNGASTGKDAGIENRLSFDFGTVFTDNSGQSLGDTLYYLNVAGFLKQNNESDDYLFVGEQEFRTDLNYVSLTSYIYDLVPEVEAMSLNLVQGDSEIITFSFTSTLPLADIEIEISEISFNKDSVHIGKPVLTQIGDAFKCDSVREKLYHYKPQYGGVSVQKRKMRILGALNTAAARDPDDTISMMEFKVPITLLKNPLFGFGSVHNITIVITESNSLLGTYSIFPHTETIGYHVLTMDVDVAQLSGGSNMQTGAPYLSDDAASLNADPVWPSSSALFEAYLFLEPGSNPVSFSSSCDGDVSVIVEIDTETEWMGFVPPISDVYHVNGSGNYGNISNLNNEDVKVKLLLIGIATQPGNPGTTVSCSLSLKGSNSISLNWTYAENSQEVSEISITPLYYSTAVLNDGDQIMIGADISVPPNSMEDLSVQFNPIPQTVVSEHPHLLHLCKIDIVNIEEDLHYLKSKKFEPRYFQSTSYEWQWLPNSGSFNLSTRPAKSLSEDVRTENKFRIRAVYEEIPNQLYFSDFSNATREVTTEIKFSNGSAWKFKNLFEAIPSVVDGFKDHNSWAACLGGWRPLPSGKKVCLIQETLYHPQRKDYCAKLDSYLVELHTREDFNAFQAYLFNLMDQFGKSTGYVATGAEIVQFTNDTVGIVWGHSKAPVDVEEDGLFKPSLGYYWDVQTGNNLILQPVNFIQGTYLAGNPTFYIKPWLYPDGSFEFVCMRDDDQVEDPINTPRLKLVTKVDETQSRLKLYEMKFNLKLERGTRSSFNFTLSEPSTDMRVCAITLSHIGSNYPCARDPNKGTPTPYNTSSVVIGYPDSSLAFMQLYNWGTGHTDFEGPVDDDTIQFTVVYENLIVSGAALVNGLLPKTVSMKTTMANYAKTMAASTETLNYNIDPAMPAFEPASSTIPIQVVPVDGTFDLVKGMCKRIRFVIDYPDTNDLVQFKAVNNDFSVGKYIHWCDFGFYQKGLNFPCLRPRNGDMKWNWWASGTMKNDTTGTVEFYDSIQTSFGTILRYPVSPEPKDNKIVFELSVRADKLAAPGTTIKLDFLLFFYHGSRTVATNFTLTVAEMTELNNPATNYTEARRSLDAFFERPKLTPYMTMGDVRETVQCKFGIRFPYNVTLRTQLLVQAPVVDGRAVLHLKSVQFGDYNLNIGDNIMGVNKYMDMERTMDVVANKSSELLTHMQRDHIYADLGYITSSDMDHNWNGAFLPKYRQTFDVYVWVEISDHPLTIDGSTQYVELGVQIGDDIIADKCEILVLRLATVADRKNISRPELELKLKTNDLPDKIYTQGESVSLTSIVKHKNTSLGEGFPAKYRVLLEEYTSFVPGKNFVTTNYTGLPIEVFVPNQQNREGSYFDIIFPTGILFPDVIEVNFSVTIDPLKKRRPGVKEYLSTVMAYALGGVSYQSGYPLLIFGLQDKYKPTTLSKYEIANFTSSFEECMKQIDILDPNLQIQASYRYGWEPLYAPANILTLNMSWTVPIRTGSEFVDKNWIEVDLLTIRRITKISVQAPASSRAPKILRIDTSYNGDTFTRGQEAIIKFDTTLDFRAPIHARFLRFVVLTTNDVTENLKAIQMYNLKIYGCVEETIFSKLTVDPLGKIMPSRKKGSKFTTRNKTVSGNDVVNYRHVSEDTDRMILYMCDINPYKDGTTCYSSADGKKFVVLQQYVHNIIGYSPITGRMYFQDKSGTSFMSSTNGKRLDVLSPDKIGAVINGTGFLPAKVVPGYDIKTLKDMAIKPAPASIFAVSYDGVMKGADPMFKWSSCCVVNDEAITEAP